MEILRPSVLMVHGSSYHSAAKASRRLRKRPDPGFAIVTVATVSPSRARIQRQSRKNGICFTPTIWAPTANIQKPVDFEQFRQGVKTVSLHWMVINHSTARKDATRSAAQGAK